MDGIRDVFGAMVAKIFATAKPSVLAKALLGVKFWRHNADQDAASGRWSWAAWAD